MAPRPFTLVLACLAACTVLTPVTVASAADVSPESPATPTDVIDPDDVPLPIDGRFHPDLADLDATSPAYDAAVDEYRTTFVDLDAAQRTANEAEAELVTLGAKRATIVRRRVELRGDIASTTTVLAGIIERRRAAAIETFVSGGADPVAEQLSDSVATEEDTRRVLTEAVDEERRDREAEAKATLVDLHIEDSALQVRLVGLDLRIGENERRRQRAELAAAALYVALLEQQPGLVDAWAAALASGTDIPLVAVDAYYRAAGIVATDDPGCGLAWSSLAGIGRTESNHARFGTRSVGVDGMPSTPIIGIALDGENQTQAIGDTDGGALDGDPVHDRAVGPMQFIPGTWRRFASDGDGDDVDDPQNLYDAALAAARYLCRSGPGLDEEPGQRRAYFSYNHSTDYVETVWTRAEQYRGSVAGRSIPAAPEKSVPIASALGRHDP